MIISKSKVIKNWNIGTIVPLMPNRWEVNKSQWTATTRDNTVNEGMTISMKARVVIPVSHACLQCSNLSDLEQWIHAMDLAPLHQC